MSGHRECGDCQLCCRLLPTEEIDKPANKKCPHQKAGVGCKVHARKPISCSLWNCRWLVDDDTRDQSRPDRSGIVIDMMPDVIRVADHVTGERQTMPCIVVWIDPHRKLAYKADAFQRYARRQTVPILIRYGSSEGGIVLFPPLVTGRDELVEHGSEIAGDMPSTLQEKARAIGASLQMPDEGVTGEATLQMPDGREIKVAVNWKVPS